MFMDFVHVYVIYVWMCVWDCVLVQVGMLNSSTTLICMNIYIYI